MAKENCAHLILRCAEPVEAGRLRKSGISGLKAESYIAVSLHDATDTELKLFVRCAAELERELEIRIFSEAKGSYVSRAVRVSPEEVSRLSDSTNCRADLWTLFIGKRRGDAADFFPIGRPWDGDAVSHLHFLQFAPGFRQSRGRR